MTELDRERAELIRRNQEMLATIGVRNAMEDLRRCQAASEAAARPIGAAGSGPAAPRPARPKRPRGEVEHIRRSGRLAGAVTAQAIADAEENDDAGEKPSGAAAGRGVGIMTQEEYLASKGQPLPPDCFRSEGRFTGWVAPEVAAKFGVAATAAEAWEKGGGGKFQRKITKADIPAHLRSKGWSDARAFAAGQLQKNPNAYFYRHTAPDQSQATGEWTAEEHGLFVATARKYGVGDKWGLFASYIPNRVGYQCSAYYVQVIIPSGLILDDRYRMDAWGDAVFVGARGGGRGGGGGDEE
ncbi:hypothetical protein PLESTF_001077600 [Pleodorina starrii]|nr:hypothetical protein PLESTF_001077600 [Pleodorina starrii]